ncbi:hypothetical protein D3C76_989590 [compost metagenome]
MGGVAAGIEDHAVAVETGFGELEAPLSRSGAVGPDQDVGAPLLHQLLGTRPGVDLETHLIAQLLGHRAQHIDAQATDLAVGPQDIETGELGADGEQVTGTGEGNHAQHPENDAEDAEVRTHAR